MTTLNSTASGALAPLWRRAFEWWLVQVKHVLPPTIELIGILRGLAGAVRRERDSGVKQASP